MYGYPHILFTAEQACRRLAAVCVLKMTELVNSCQLNTQCFHLFFCWKRQIDVERNSMQTTCRIMSRALIWTPLVTEAMSENYYFCLVCWGFAFYSSFSSSQVKSAPSLSFPLRQLGCEGHGKRVKSRSHYLPHCYCYCHGNREKSPVEPCFFSFCFLLSILRCLFIFE